RGRRRTGAPAPRRAALRSGGGRAAHFRGVPAGRHGPGADGHRADVAGAGGLSHPLLGQPDGGLKIILEFPCRFFSIARPPLQSFIAIRGAAMSCRTPRSLTAAVRAALFGLGLPLLAAPLSLPALADGHSYS